jgi:hypothetical protein
MASEKHAYELKAHLNSAEIAVGDKLIRFDSDKHYETSDPSEVRALDEFHAVKAVEAGSKKKDGD